MSSRIGLTLACLASLAVFGGACGGNNDATSANEDMGPKAEYIAEADATCARQTRKIRRLIGPYTKGRSYAELRPTEATAMVRKVLAPSLGYEVRSVRILVLPEQYVGRVLHFLAVWQQAVDKAEKNPVAFIYARKPFAEDERLARKFGFRICGSFSP